MKLTLPLFENCRISVYYQYQPDIIPKLCYNGIPIKKSADSNTVRLTRTSYSLEDLLACPLSNDANIAATNVTTNIAAFTTSMVSNVTTCMFLSIILSSLLLIISKTMMASQESGKLKYCNKKLLRILRFIILALSMQQEARPKILWKKLHNN